MRSLMPVIARHEGAWTGEYVHMDADGKVLDRHRADLSCHFPESGAHDYHQTNIYTWADGRREELHFPADCRDGRIWWDTDRIQGYCWEIDPRTVALTWTRKDMPDTYLYEIINISEDNKRRARTWHWFERDTLVKRTCIREQRVR